MLALAAQPTPSYYVVSLNMEINQGSQDYLSEVIHSAEVGGVRVIVLNFTTPGGNSQNMLSMISQIDSYEGWGGEFVVYGIQPGVFSAGSIISEAADQVYLQNGSSFGGASPIFSSPEPTYVVQKIMGAYASLVASEADQHGRNGTAAGMMVSADVSQAEGGLTYTWEQAVRLHVVNGAVPSLQQLLLVLERSGVIQPEAVQKQVYPSLADQFRYDLSDATLDALLLDLGFFAVLVDVLHPTGLASLVGIVSLLLGIYGMGLIGAPPLAFLLIVLGGAMMFLEVKAGHGLFAAAGVVVSLVGLLLLYGQVLIQPLPSSPSAPGSFVRPSQQVSPLFTGIEFGLLAVTVGFASLYLSKLRRELRSKPRLVGLENMVGKLGVSQTDFQGGQGVIQVSSEQWSARSAGDQEIKKGDKVVVLSVDGIVLVVRKVQQ